MKILEESSVAAVLLEYKHEGMDSEAIACHIKQRFPNLPIILLSAYSEMPERILARTSVIFAQSVMAGILSVPEIKETPSQLCTPSQIFFRQSRCAGGSH